MSPTKLRADAVVLQVASISEPDKIVLKTEPVSNPLNMNPKYNVLPACKDGYPFVPVVVLG